MSVSVIGSILMLVAFVLSLDPARVALPGIAVSLPAGLVLLLVNMLTGVVSVSDLGGIVRVGLSGFVDPSLPLTLTVVAVVVLLHTGTVISGRGREFVYMLCLKPSP